MNRWLLLLISFTLIAFGQPAYFGWLGLIGAVCGFALFWKGLLDFPSKRLLIATLWFTGIQYIQLDWVLSHPFYYIYPVLLVYGLIIGLQFGVASLFVTNSRLNYIWFSPVLAAIWTLMEYGRLLFFSGFAWNPVGLLLTGALYPLQSASVAGVYGLSFWIILTNALVLQFWVVSKRAKLGVACMVLIAAPYLFGFAHVSYHTDKMAAAPKLKALLLQTNFPCEETLHFTSMQHAIAHSLLEWQEILTLLKPHLDQPVDLIVLPEVVVPWGTYWPIYHHQVVEAGWQELFGTERPLHDPAKGLAMQQLVAGEATWMVTNAYLAQTVANAFQADTVIGLSDEENGESYNAAFVFSPMLPWQTRYEKRLPIPLGEYMPFEWCRDLAKQYGVCGSLTPGKEAKVIQGAKVPFGLSVCYEETCGNLMRENRLNGAELLVNVTNDGWFPQSRLPQQHFDHSRLRTVEMGIPLVRACNTGVTGACDSLGQVLGAIPESAGQAALLIDVPLYHYFTLYTLWGDLLVIGLSCCFVGIAGIYFQYSRYIDK